MKNQSLLFRYKRYMSTANWRKTKAGYSLGLVAGIFKRFFLMILLPAIVS